MTHNANDQTPLLLNGPAGDSSDDVEATLQMSKLNFEEPDVQRASLQTLPTEILVSIFHFALAQNHARIVILAQICHSLRQVVVSTPLLRTTLSLSGKRHPEEKAELWLSRNPSLLRALYIRDASSGVQEALKSLDGVSLDNLRALTTGGHEYRQQCPEIALSFLTPAVVPKLLSLTPTRVNSGWLDGTSELQIRHLDTRSSIYDWNALVKQTGQLRVFNHDDSQSGRCRLSDIHGILHSNPELESVTLKLSTWRRGPPDLLQQPSPFGSIKLVHLTYLSLDGYMRPGELFIPPLSLPNLRYLELQGLYDGWNEIIQALITGNAVGRLISLAIVYKYFSYSTEREAREDTFIELFRHTKQLRCLELFRVTHIGSVVRALADDPATLCPNLRTLDVSRCPDVDDELLRVIVNARNGETMLSNDTNDSLDGSLSSASAGAITSLYKLVFNSCEKVTPSTVSWLRERVPHVTCHYNRERRERHHRKPKRGELYV